MGSDTSKPGRGEGPEQAVSAHSQAVVPWQFGMADWKAILARVAKGIGQNYLSLIASGVAFYAMLALFPMIGALGAVYGLFADPADIERQLAPLRGIAPPDVMQIIEEQVAKVAGAPSEALSFGAALGTLFAVWSAKAATSAAVKGCNIVYEEDDRRGFVASIFMGYVLTFALLCVSAVALGVLVAAPAVLKYVSMGFQTERLIVLVRWPIGLATMAIAIGMVYRFGPARSQPRIAWITPGAVIAAVLWLLVSLLFTFYVANFANYNETYGSLGAVIGLLMWFYLSAFVVLLGCQLNAEMERQTAADTTTGRPRPLGQRGAKLADTAV